MIAPTVFRPDIYHRLASADDGIPTVFRARRHTNAEHDPLSIVTGWRDEVDHPACL
jgi:hypothetical protein